MTLDDPPFCTYEISTRTLMFIYPHLLKFKNGFSKFKNGFSVLFRKHPVFVGMFFLTFLFELYIMHHITPKFTL